MAGYRSTFGDSYCGPGATWIDMPGGGICYPDAPVPPPIDWGQVLNPLPLIVPAPQGQNNPAHPVGVALNPPGAAPLGGSNLTMLLLIGGATLLFMTMGKGGRR